MDKKPMQEPMYRAPDQFMELNRLAEVTRIPRAVLAREAIDDLLKKCAKVLKGGSKE